MKVTMMLADSVQAVGGKLYILGGGWSITAPGVPSGVAIYFQVPWDQTDDKHNFKLELLTSDGETVPDELGNPVAVDGEFQVGRPPGLKRGTPIDVPVAFNFPPLPVEPDQRYEWRLTTNDQSDDTWRLAFNVQAVPPAVGPPGPAF